MFLGLHTFISGLISLFFRNLFSIHGFASPCICLCCLVLNTVMIWTSRILGIRHKVACWWPKLTANIFLRNLTPHRVNFPDAYLQISRADKSLPRPSARTNQSARPSWLRAHCYAQTSRADQVSACGWSVTACMHARTDIQSELFCNVY